jgi:hypothetical protein
VVTGVSLLATGSVTIFNEYDVEEGSVVDVKLEIALEA